MTVVGIVRDVRHNGVDEIIKEKFYVPHAQFNVVSGNSASGMALVVKTNGDPLSVAAPIRAILREMDRNLPLANVRSMDDVVATAIATPRFTGWLLVLFAVLALTLSAVGIYGVLAFLVSQRTHEIGIRLAIGADSSRVLRMILGRGLGLALIGVAAGVARGVLPDRPDRHAASRHRAARRHDVRGRAHPAVAGRARRQLHPCAQSDAGRPADGLASGIGETREGSNPL